MTQTQKTQKQNNGLAAISSTFITGVCSLAIIFATMNSEALAEPVPESQEHISRGSSATLSPAIGVTSFALKSEGYDNAAKSGITVGALYTQSTGTENIAWEIGLQYLETGGQQGNVFVNNKLQLSYLMVPVGGRWKFAQFGQATSEKSVYLKGGLAPSFLMTAKSKLSVFGESTEKDIKAETNSLDVLVYGGLGMTYSLGEAQAFAVELNYMQGTQKVLKDYDSKNEGLVATIMYSLSM